MHLATQDAHLLNYSCRIYFKKILRPTFANNSISYLFGNAITCITKITTTNTSLVTGSSGISNNVVFFCTYDQKSYFQKLNAIAKLKGAVNAKVKGENQNWP
jgi:hypothetical protein